MRYVIFFALVTTIGCSPSNEAEGLTSYFGGIFKSDITSLDTLSFDTLQLKKIILKNDKLLGVFRFRHDDEEQQKRLNDETFRTGLYKDCNYRVVRDKSCGENRHIYILKTRNKNFDIEPYRALYLVMLNAEGEEILTHLIAEKLHIQAITSLKVELQGQLMKDSLLSTYSESSTCSDVIIDGKTSCWTNKEWKSYKLKCDGLELIKSDSKRIEN